MRNRINATPIDFQTGDWKSLWEELKGVFDFWIEQGVKIFRVDDPHTKSLRFWAWYIPEIRRHHPDVIFLSEAFTRPRVMYHLAKLGFTQSYTYFAWRNHAWEPALDLDARSLLLGSPPGGHPDPCSTCAREGQACNVSVPPGP